jgi:hypothetical protein
MINKYQIKGEYVRLRRYLKNSFRSTFPHLGIKILDVNLRNDPEEGKGSGYICDAKWTGTALDEIIWEMEVQGYDVPLELVELKNYLRFKGNSHREEGDYSLWEEDEDV